MFYKIISLLPEAHINKINGNKIYYGKTQSGITIAAGNMSAAILKKHIVNCTKLIVVTNTGHDIASLEEMIVEHFDSTEDTIYFVASPRKIAQLKKTAGNAFNEFLKIKAEETAKKLPAIFKYLLFRTYMRRKDSLMLLTIKEFNTLFNPNTIIENKNKNYNEQITLQLKKYNGHLIISDYFNHINAIKNKEIPPQPQTIMLRI